MRLVPLIRMLAVLSALSLVSAHPPSANAANSGPAPGATVKSAPNTPTLSDDDFNRVLAAHGLPALASDVSLYPDLQIGGPNPDVTIKPPPELHPSPLDTMVSALRRYGGIFAFFADEMQHVDPYKVEPGFDFKMAAQKAGHADQYLDRYASVFNQRAADALTAKIKREEADDRVLAASGTFGMTLLTLAAGGVLVIGLWVFVMPNRRKIAASADHAAVGAAAAGIRATRSVRAGLSSFGRRAAERADAVARRTDERRE